MIHILGLAFAVFLGIVFAVKYLNWIAARQLARDTKRGMELLYPKAPPQPLPPLHVVRSADPIEFAKDRVYLYYSLLAGAVAFIALMFNVH